jgi:peptidoglycan/xylan/chitin deacetylase (PgdA/CDA1 family)
MREIFLNFHGLGEPPPGIDRSERRYWWDESHFVLVLDHLLAAPPGSGPTIRLTFDDGNMSDAKIAMPALARRGLTARFFVCAGRVGERGYLDAAAIRDLLAAGMTIGTHGMRHVDWRSIDDAELHSEVSVARRVLEDVGERDVDEVGIPFGSYDRRVLAKIRSEGYRHAYTSDGGTVRPSSWLKARNTLDRSWQRKSLLEELTARNSLARRLRRGIMNVYKGAPLTAMMASVAIV